MANSLQDQLLQAGLASSMPLEVSRRRERHARPRKAAGKKATAGMDLAKAYALRAQEERRERAEKEQREKETAARRKKIRTEIHAIMEGARLNDERAQCAYYFEHFKRFRHVYVTAEQQQALSRGELAIVWLQRRYHIVARSIGDRVATLDAEAVVLMQDRANLDPT